MATRARERLVEAAEQLFYSEGIRAVGVERLVAVSGVGRASFYRHFAGKDDLVVTMLRGYDERFRAWLAEAVEALGGGPLAVFDALAASFEAEGFRGCASINAMVEMADADSAAHQVAAEHKTKVIDYLDSLLIAAGQPRHRDLAEQFMLLFDGAIVTALRERTAEPAHRAKAIAESLLRA
ncbi:TetR/AcrR family transcriptional regulator [Saccharopolyspora oryzae]|uniref:TetR/AcrR family transcriptional regulator n=1 Tax=Saccharopolyspora oryzae TaxID=2997343 RepID=A0ABT4UWL2_9PSEU|nr:TetR/AcrR family transcriptional regulator [Saccharopolyspora oryzae]MDA3625938.1 TetR/AcrR family transcriptional regulator [Saccharopolyspora oryzae]